MCVQLVPMEMSTASIVEKECSLLMDSVFNSVPANSLHIKEYHASHVSRVVQSVMINMTIHVWVVQM
jgi:hypothetical protein